MRYLYSLVLIGFLSFISCGDGDIKVSNFDFENSNLETCSSGDKRVFFKRNTSSPESIALSIPNIEEAFLETQSIEIQLNSNYKLSYRLHDDFIQSNYFCQAIPPIEPSTKQEYVSETGTAILDIEVINSNIEEGKDLDSYPYTLTTRVSIVLKNISLNNGNETIIRETYVLGTIPNFMHRTINGPSQE